VVRTAPTSIDFEDGQHGRTGMVYGLPRVDLLTLTALVAVLAVVVVLAAVVPLRRALAVSPRIALRAE